jgi:DNA-directed RNA polymerase subunit omega
LPSKRARKIPEKIQVSREDLEELKRSSVPEIFNKTEESKDSDVSLENLKEKEAQENTDIKEDTETTNS